LCATYSEPRIVASPPGKPIFDTDIPTSVVGWPAPAQTRGDGVDQTRSGCLGNTYAKSSGNVLFDTVSVLGGMIRKFMTLRILIVDDFGISGFNLGTIRFMPLAPT